jgi:membrane-bound lytic murein transglycosylase B
LSVAVITPVLLAVAVGATPQIHTPTTAFRGAAISPAAAFTSAGTGPSGPAVVTIAHPPTSFHIAAGVVSAPAPPMIVNAQGALGIPVVALTAYRRAEQKMAVEAPGCGLSWNLLAGIGRIESAHAGGGAVDARGTAIVPIYGPALDGTPPGNEVIPQSSVGDRVTYARAMGPMQFLPGTWARYASDGTGDGTADPQNVFDATLAAARYLCAGGLNLRDPEQVMEAILRYNNSLPYAQNVLGWAAAYATGVVPVDLPPITGPRPPLGNAHDDRPEGPGPGAPMNVLPADDPLTRMPLIDLGPHPQILDQPPMYPWMTPNTPPHSQTQLPGCTMICIGRQDPLPPPQQPPWVTLSPPDAPPSPPRQTVSPEPSTSPPSSAFSPAEPSASPAANTPATPGPMPGTAG